MFEDAATLTLFGHTIYIYGIFIALGIIASAVLLLWRARKQPQTMDAALLALPLVTVMGLVGARLLFAVSDSTFRGVFSLSNLMAFHTGGYAMYGALLGMALGLWMAARLTKQNAAPLFDLAAPSWMLFVGFARLGEGYTAIGTGRPVLTDALRNTVLTVQDEYGDYLRTYALEAVVAFALCIALLIWMRKPRRVGYTALIAALWYGVTQTLMESLRNDRHLDFGFVGLQHVLSAVLFGAVLIFAAVRWLRAGRPRPLGIVALVSLPILVAAVIALEFAIDRTDWNKLLCYVVYAVLLCWPLYITHKLLAFEEVV